MATPNTRINDALSFLVHEQEADGRFVSYSSPHEDIRPGSRAYHAVFPNSLILASLSGLTDETAVHIRERLVAYLLSQRSSHWSFNYWGRDTAESKEKPYPDDLDDTSCTLGALTLHDKSLVDGSVLANVAHLLVAVEAEEGGPYRTWLVQPEAETVWRDVDLVVNANIGWFLSLHGVTLKNVERFIESAITKQAYTSPYYPSVYPAVYFISRWYQGGMVHALIDTLCERESRDGGWGNPLDTALAVSALCNFGVAESSVERGIERLRMWQEPDGSWPARAFCIDPSIESVRHYAGSTSLTTAFCLEALQPCADPKSTTQVSLQTPVSSERHTRIRTSVIAEVTARFDAAPTNLRAEGLSFLKKALVLDEQHHIILLPTLFRDALGSHAANISDDFVASLGLANLYGWIAYTIYDDFLDEEGQTAQLSVANLCLRELSRILRGVLPAGHGFSQVFEKVMDTIDGANTWEVTHCRADLSHPTTIAEVAIPEYHDFKNLSNRSLGHALGPVAILMSIGYTADSEEVKHVMDFFRHYLLARQLNDEAHDWEDDLKRGHINAVAALILKHQRRTDAGAMVDITNLRPQQELLWNGPIITDVCSFILDELSTARRMVEQVPVIEEYAVFEAMLAPIARAAHEALSERDEAVKFLHSYTGTPAK